MNWKESSFSVFIIIITIQSWRWSHLIYNLSLILMILIISWFFIQLHSAEFIFNHDRNVYIFRDIFFLITQHVLNCSFLWWVYQVFSRMTKQCNFFIQNNNFNLEKFNLHFQTFIHLSKVFNVLVWWKWYVVLLLKLSHAYFSISEYWNINIWYSINILHANCDKI